MAVPKRKQTPSRTGMRRAQNMKFSSKNIVLKIKNLVSTDLSHHYRPKNWYVQRHDKF
jgi:large subunit ribosomal protein L32